MHLLFQARDRAIEEVKERDTNLYSRIKEGPYTQSDVLRISSKPHSYQTMESAAPWFPRRGTQKINFTYSSEWNSGLHLFGMLYL